MKKILCLLLFILFVLPVQAVTLEGSVTYTVEQAREEAFKDIEWEIPKQLLRKHRKDPNYTMNMYAKKYSQKVLRDRAITFFLVVVMHITILIILNMVFFMEKKVI